MSFISTRFLREGRRLDPELEEARLSIEGLAKGYGLDFFETIFEMCTYEEINMIAAYGGFPTRYPHWRFGMEYLQMQTSYEYGLSKIYEMVINTDPSYAYLLDCNLVVDQKLVMSHVFGHVDFFKNNLWFAHTDRKMLDTVANHATRVRQHMNRHGAAEVEAFIDLCLSLDNLIDTHAPFIERTRSHTAEEVEAAELDRSVGRIPAKPYMDPHINPREFLQAQRQKKAEELDQMRSFPEEPERDVLKFLMRHAPLASWQRDVMHIVHAEAMYFAPQGQTKIMNEGWATYWHTKLMTQHVLTDAEVVDYADHHSGTVHTTPGKLNPYKLGVELWKHIERRWDRGQHGRDWLDCDDPRERDRWDKGSMEGREKLFEVRKTHNDVTFLDSFLTADFCREQGFFTTKFDKKSRRWVLDSREFSAIKRQLLEMVSTRGSPRIDVVDANAHNRGELRLVHNHEGLDLKLEWAQTVLGNLCAIWGRSVLLDTVLDGKAVRLTHDGSDMKNEPRKGPA